MSNASKEATEMNETTAPPDTRTRQPPQEMRKIAASPGIGLSVRTSGGVLATAKA